MQIRLVIISITAAYLTYSQAALANEESKLLKAFHRYGITKCDKFIKKNSPLKTNWNYFINKISGGMDGPATEVTITRIWGSKGDTVKSDETYIQTAKNCYLRQSWSLTFNGTCTNNVDGDAWYISTAMPDKDYTTYTNRGGVEMHAKEISVGNFKACLQEGYRRTSAAHG